MQYGRRRFLRGAAGLTGAGLLGASAGRSWALPSAPPTRFVLAPDESPLAPPGSPGLVDEATWQAMVDEYLHLVTGGNPAVVTHLVRAHREPGYVWDAGGVDVGDFASWFATIDNWDDTRDFRFMDMCWILHLADGATPTRTIDPSVIQAFEDRMAANRWRYDDPYPADRDDNQWYWSENHIIIGLCDEYLAGQRMPGRVFDITGLTGAEHMTRSKPDILAWIEERARFGFFEFHSRVYMRFNIKPLTMLAELANDPELIRAAGMALDLCLLDAAAHNHQGSYVAPQGRVYVMRDAMPWTLSRFLFRDSPVPLGTGADNTTDFLCAAQRYRAPQTILDVAVSPGESLVRERHGIYVDPAAAVVADPVAPFGYDFDDPENLEFWWSQGAIGLWQTSETSIQAAHDHRLFEQDALAEIALLVSVIGEDPNVLEPYLRRNHAILNYGHLQEVNTYHWRNDAVALSSAQDYRFGSMRDQVKAWQAVIDERAIVYTTHPSTEPGDEVFDNDGKPGYWTGEASMPRSAQHERTAVHIYQPEWDETTAPLLWLLFSYLDYTHAFFPQDHFDEVVQHGNWTFGREGDGYIGLWSWRVASWRTYGPGVDTGGMVLPFDLVAEGGPDNVWIVEVGDAGQGSFAAWVAERVAAEPTVVRDIDGFTVDWTSPASGALAFGSTGPFTVDGVEQPLSGFPRHESPWGEVGRLEMLHSFATAHTWLELDFDGMSRTHGDVSDPTPTTTTPTTTTPTTTSPPPAPNADGEANATGPSPAPAPAATPTLQDPRFTG